MKVLGGLPTPRTPAEIVDGQGVFARLLRENGFRVLEPEDLP